MENKQKKIIAVCASVSHYKYLFPLEIDLKLLGFKVILPKTARKMKKSGDFDVDKHKAWYKDKSLYKVKTALMKSHFKEIEKSDAILVANHEKNGIKGYIGGNTLMEMTVAFLNKKPIFVLNTIDENLGIKEEIYGVNSIFLNGDLNLISSHFKK